MDISKIVGKSIAVHCDTEAKAKAFLEECARVGGAWGSGTPLTVTNWSKYRENTCYVLEYGLTSIEYSSVSYYAGSGCTIIEYVDAETVAKRQKQMPSVYAGMTAKFTPDTHIYSVYISTADVKLDKVPAMTLVDDNGQKCYRLEAPYFTDPLCSTCLLDRRYLNTALKLKCGTVYYFTSKTQALQTAKEAKAQKIAEKVAATAKLQEELKHLRSIKIAFD